jgi:hypothetical protein
MHNTIESQQSPVTKNLRSTRVRVGLGKRRPDVPTGVNRVPYLRGTGFSHPDGLRPEFDYGYGACGCLDAPTMIVAGAVQKSMTASRRFLWLSQTIFSREFLG